MTALYYIGGIYDLLQEEVDDLNLFEHHCLEHDDEKVRKTTELLLKCVDTGNTSYLSELPDIGWTGSIVLKDLVMLHEKYNSVDMCDKEYMNMVASHASLKTVQMLRNCVKGNDQFPIDIILHCACVYNNMEVFDYFFHRYCDPTKIIKYLHTSAQCHKTEQFIKHNSNIIKQLPENWFNVYAIIDMSILFYNFYISKYLIEQFLIPNERFIPGQFWQQICKTHTRNADELKEVMDWYFYICPNPHKKYDMALGIWVAFETNNHQVIQWYKEKEPFLLTEFYKTGIEDYFRSMDYYQNDINKFKAIFCTFTKLFDSTFIKNYIYKHYVERSHLFDKDVKNLMTCPQISWADYSIILWYLYGPYCLTIAVVAAELIILRERN